MRPRFPLLCAMALLAGCSSMPGTRPEPATATASVEAVQVAQLTSYANALHAVVRGSPAEQAEVLDSARSGCEDAHQGPGCLRYALLLAAPAHPGRNPQAALRLLREVGTHPELLSQVERTLVDLETARMELELGLVTENARLVADSQAAERDRPRNTAPAIAALNARLQAEINDNARLKKERDELQAKLDAIANIERNIPARPPAIEGRKP